MATPPPLPVRGFDLRPLSLGEILDRAFSLYRQHFLLFIGLVAVPQTFVFASALYQNLNPASTLPLVLNAVGAFILNFLVSTFCNLLAQGSVIFALRDVYLGRPASIAGSYREVFAHLGTLFGAACLNGLAIFGGFLLFFIPGVFLVCRLLVCIPAALVEQLSARESLSRSFLLTKGFAWRALGIVFFNFGLAMVATSPGLIFVFLNQSFRTLLGTVLSTFTFSVASILVTPISLMAIVIYYFDLRVRKEAFDLQIMMDPGSEHRAPGAGSLPSILS